MKISHTTYPILLTLILTLAPLLSQNTPPTPEPIELRELRQQTEQQTLLKSSTLTEQYLKALATIEQEASATADYEQALLIQQRRHHLSQLHQLTNQNNSIILKPNNATRFVGAVSYVQNSNSLFPWRTPGSSASWEISKITPGKYDVHLTYGVAPLGEIPTRQTTNYNPQTGGQFEFYEDSNLPGASTNRRTGNVTSTGEWTSHNTLQLTPPLQLTRTTARLTLRILRTNGDGGVMQLKEIRLTPTPENQNPTTTTPSDPVHTQQLTHQQKLKTLATPIITTYLQNLQNLLTQATTNQQTDTINELNSEINRTQKWLDRPTTTSRTATFNLLENTDDEWNNVSYIDDPTNTGDHFLVQHNSVKFPIRLKNISCPPPHQNAIGELQHYAAYFQISPEDALTIGKQAHHFTNTTLKNKTFRLLSNGQKDRQGRLLATIILPHLGDYAGILIDNGLATITPTHKPHPNTSHTHIALQQREKHARQRPTPPGAWAYRDTPTTTNP